MDQDINQYLLDKKICQVTEIFEVLKILKKYFDKRNENFRSDPDKHHVLGEFPFGLWFRGQCDADWNLEPKVFRENPDGKQYDETNIVYQFECRSPEYSLTHRNTFDWLSLMQHYNAPTRLLDWTESPLVALYFATEIKKLEKKDGKLFILDARKLNSITTQRKTGSLRTREHADVQIRSCMAKNREKEALLREILQIDNINLNFYRYNEDVVFKNSLELKTDLEKQLENFCTTIAVYPHRLNHRLNVQSGVFTLHGGKKYTENEMIKESERIPNPKSFDETCDAAVYTWCVIPYKAKETIQRELFTLGIHESSLFPELEHQSKYLERHWLQ